MQAAYVRWLLAEANRLDARLVTWFFPEDINRYLEEEQKRNPAAAGLAAMAMNLGLHDRQFRPRPAAAEWEQWKRRRPAR
jgi:hypothetical protein